ncbi:unnamed protein product [Linum trigynum]|uniref:Reverse transcriptase zinc-binding domain-containing protein n=1 Tax=Linum trigynum TaxID=586398 RepID=A0AAV2FHZ5_9ROSI
MDKPSWIRVWEAKIPPKLKVFLWQILNRALPTMEALIEKKVQVLPRCPVCWDAPETMEHLFLYCPVARALWDYSGLEYLGEGLPRHTFSLFLKRLLGLIHQPSVVMAVVAILWRIWRSRNWVVFEGKQFGIPALMRQFYQQYEEWMDLPADQTPMVQAPIGCLMVQWVMPSLFACGTGLLRVGLIQLVGWFFLTKPICSCWLEGSSFLSWMIQQWWKCLCLGKLSFGV